MIVMGRHTVSGVLAGRPPFPCPGGGALAQARRDVGVSRRELAPRAGALFLFERETALKTSKSTVRYIVTCEALKTF